MGVVVGGFGGGAFIFNQIQVTSHANTKYHKKLVYFTFNQIQTAILNPNNVSTDGLYFEDAALLG